MGSAIQTIKPSRMKQEKSGLIGRKVLELARGALDRVLLFNRLNEVAEEVALFAAPERFLEALLARLGIYPEVAEEDLARIPANGAVVAVANHPFGAMETLVLAAVLRRARPDVKVIASPLFTKVADFGESLVYVETDAKKRDVWTNFSAMRNAAVWLRTGGTMGVFPAGDVWHLSLGRPALDGSWSVAVAHMVRKTGAAVLPMYLNGSGAMAQLRTLVHPKLRRALLPHDLLNGRNHWLKVRIGNVIPYKKLAEFANDAEMMAYLRQRTYLLEKRASGERALTTSWNVKRTPEGPVRVASIASAEPSDVLARELSALPSAQRLVEFGEFDVYYARANEIPHVLREIGRLREITFRETGEGTGKALDLDEFDDYYRHLFLWNRGTREIVGAYRLGKTDVILRRFGSRGLYTSTLFRFKPGLIERISPALEMGRSFVRPEYQRTYAALPLLWRGIGQYILKYPRYRMLFGPVSISNEYQTVSRQLMVAFLREHCFLEEMSELVEARTPFRAKPTRGCDTGALGAQAGNVEELGAMIADVESGKGVPILLKHYLKLGGQVLGFNVDPNFGDCVDGLILVDLTKTDRRILERHLGKEGAAGFLAYHRSIGREAS